jgi:ribonuclease D
MLDSLPPPVWVNSKNLLQEMVNDLVAHPSVAVDTESNSLHAFREQVCLLQFSTPNADYIVDPLEVTDLELLGSIFSNPKIEKIFHAAEYDLICLKRDFGFKFANIFDTMQAARIIGYPAVGLDRLLGDKFGIKVDKRHQKADWAARPLTEEQIHYARLDTHYLFDLRAVMEKELIESDRLHFALEDFSRACSLEEPKQKGNGASWERFSGRKDLSPRELTIISFLCKWRDHEAERLNRPPYKVVMDETFIQMAKNPPLQKVDLSAAGLSEKQIRLWGDALLSAIRHGEQAPLVTPKRVERKSDAVVRRLEKLKAWRKGLGQEMKVESDVILPKPYLSMLSETPPQTMEELADLMKDTPSRMERFGPQIFKILGGKNAN